MAPDRFVARNKPKLSLMGICAVCTYFIGEAVTWKTAGTLESFGTCVYAVCNSSYMDVICNNGLFTVRNIYSAAIPLSGACREIYIFYRRFPEIWKDLRIIFMRWPHFHDWSSAKTV